MGCVDDRYFKDFWKKENSMRIYRGSKIDGKIGFKAFHKITPINKNMYLFIHTLLHNHASRGIDVTFD